MKHIKKIVVGMMVVLLFTTFCAGKGGSIVGKWESSDKQGTIEFFEDGNMTMDVQGFKINGTYNVEGNKLITKITMFGQEAVDTSNFSVKGKTLKITNKDGSESIFKRIK